MNQDQDEISPEADMSCSPSLHSDSPLSQVGRMFRSRTPSPTRVEALRVQAAATSDITLSRYLEELKKQIDAGFGVMTSRLDGLDTKYEAMSQQIQPLVVVHKQQQQVLTQTQRPQSQNLASQNLTQNFADPHNPASVSASGLNACPNSDLSTVAHSLEMEVDENAPLNPVIPEPYRPRKIDSVRFRPLEQRLASPDQFKVWKRSVVGQFEIHDCLFLLVDDEPVPSDFTGEDIIRAKRKAKYFIRESLSEYYQDLIQDLTDPRDIMTKLQSVCDPSSTFQLKRLVSEFNSIRFDPNAEKAIEFLGRFDDLQKRLLAINPDMLTPVYVKTIFELAIDATVTYQKAELHSFKFTLTELRDMLLEEQLRRDQSNGGNAYSTFRSRVATTRGRGGGRGGGRSGGKSSGIPGASSVAKMTSQSAFSSKSKVSKKPYCTYCKSRGHTKETCLKARRLCFKCQKSTAHIAANCPMNVASSSRPTPTPGGSRLPNPPSVQNRLTRQQTPKTKPPKQFQMPLGHAKRLAQEFQQHPDSIFAIAGPTTGPDDLDVWVTMGDEEEQHVSTLNFVSERSGHGSAFQMSEEPSDGLRLVEVRIDKHVVRGNATVLECRFDLQGETLYSVKWYKDGHEFYRYVPQDIPPAQLFPLPGVHVRLDRSNETQVALGALDLSSTGRYRCEVSAEAPSFQTVSDHGDMQVVALPEEGPRIHGGKPRYQAGDLVQVNCTSGRSKPAATLSWYINGEQATGSYLRGPYMRFEGRDGLIKTTLGLEFRVERRHFRRGDLKLRCIASIAAVYYNSNEESVEGDRPQRPPALEVKDNQPLSSHALRREGRLSQRWFVLSCFLVSCLVTGASR